MEITIGDGRVSIGGVIHKDGYVGILLHLENEAHEINKETKAYEAGEKYVPEKEDVIIWLKNLDGARVLQDRLNLEVLNLNGFELRALVPAMAKI